VLGPAAALGAVEAAYAAALLDDRFEVPGKVEFLWIFLASALAATALAAGLGWSVLRLVRTRSAVSQLAADLAAAPQPGRPRERLADALGAPALQIAYWLPGLRRYVDGEGRAMAPEPAGKGRAATPIVRAGQEVAVVVHDTDLLDGARLVREIGASARLVV